MVVFAPTRVDQARSELNELFITRRSAWAESYVGVCAILGSTARSG